VRNRTAAASAFQRHGEEDRILLVIYDGQVCEIFTFLMRWRCVTCERTFRKYPDGVYPYKRYVVFELIVLALRYLQDPQISYRQAVRHRCVPIAYAHEEPQANDTDAQKACEDGRQLAHSTLWRSVSFIATWWKGLRKRAERRARVGTPPLACQKIDPFKYRSEERRRTLIDAAKSLLLWPGRKYPTEIETRSASP
jgi:hypothetical protein